MKRFFTFFAAAVFLSVVAAENAPFYLLIDGKAGNFVPTPDLSVAGNFQCVAPRPGETVPLLTVKHKKYLAMPDEIRLKKFAGELKSAKKLPENCNRVKLLWQGGDASGAVVTVSERPGLAPSVSVTADNRELLLGNLKIATKYYWRVTDKTGTSPVFSFETEAVAPRVVSVKGTWNVRDLGGRTGRNGRRVKQGMIYRSAGLNENASNGKAGRNRLDPETQKYVAENLNWKTDLDLRNDEECAGMTGSPAGEKVAWIHIPSSMYGYIVRKNFGREAFKKEFKLLLDEKNYPVVFHCINGKDRTGTLAYILNALLGVDERELALDWEFTRLCKPHAGLQYEWIDAMKKEFSGYAPDAAVSGGIEKWVLSLGITPQEIDRFREIMLEAPEK